MLSSIQPIALCSPHPITLMLSFEESSSAWMAFLQTQQSLTTNPGRGWQDQAGLPFNWLENEALRGVSRRELLLQIVGDRQFLEAKLQEMMDRKSRYYGESIQNIAPADLLPGAVIPLDELRQAGIKMAIASASKNARSGVEKLGIGDRLDAIADGYSVQCPKPAPDLFLYAAN